MRVRTLRALFSTLFVFALLLAGGIRSVYAQSIKPLLSATVGKGANTSYFVLDFESGPAPESFAFAYNYNGTQNGDNLIDALIANVSGFNASYSVDPTYGRFYQSFTYNGETLTPTGNSYWSYWLSSDGATWTSSDTGTQDRNLSNGSWDGWSYATDFLSAAPPTTPLAASAAAPEPGTLSLGLLGGISLIGVFARRRRS